MNATEIGEELLHLKLLLEKSLGRSLNTTTDYQYLEGAVWGRTGKSLSLSTLKRVWGYVDGYSAIRQSTLDILAQTAGYANFAVFVNDYCNSEDSISSKLLQSNAILEKDIPVDSRVEITWNPSRRVVIKHLGEGRFEVLTSENSKLTTGDTFRCLSFFVGHPLYLTNYVHLDSKPGSFVIGNNNGLTSVKILKDKK